MLNRHGEPEGHFRENCSHFAIWAFVILPFGFLLLEGLVIRVVKKVGGKKNWDSATASPILSLKPFLIDDTSPHCSHSFTVVHLTGHCIVKAAQPIDVTGQERASAWLKSLDTCDLA